MGGQLSLYQQGPWCFYLLLHLACWAWSACSPRADSDPVPLCPQMGPKETDDTRQQTTLPINRLCCHLYGCWHYRTHLKCLKWLLSAAGSAHRLWCSIKMRSLKRIISMTRVTIKIYKHDQGPTSAVTEQVHHFTSYRKKQKTRNLPHHTWPIPSMTD